MLRDALIWWLASSVLGWLLWPLCARVLGQSAGRGYALCRPFGLLLYACGAWLLGLTGLWPNTVAGARIWAGTVALAGIGLWWRAGRTLWSTVRHHWRHVLTVELLYLLVGMLYCLYRAHNPAISHTEQPMDFALLNSVLRSPGVPPDDPWFAGYSVSYYYLGYWIIAQLAHLTGVRAGVAYNLGLAQTVALAVSGAYGVLSALAAEDQGGSHWRRRAGIIVLFGAVAIALASNLEPLLELLRALGAGSAAFYRWVAVPGLAEAPLGGGWPPVGAWWWRASRLGSDWNLLLKSTTTITEFPAFSLVLGDLHPHVMALPYCLFAIALAWEWLQAARNGLVMTWWRQARFLWAPVLLGALGLINSWDLPVYAALALVAAIAGLLMAGPVPARERRRQILCVATLVLWVCLGSVLLYAPFYRQLETPVYGFATAYYVKTPLGRYLLHWGVWLLPIVAQLASRRGITANEPALQRRRGLFLWGIFLVLPWLGTWLLGGWGRLILGLGMAFAVGPWLLLLQSGLLAWLGVDLWRLLETDCEGRLAQCAWRLLAIVGLGLTYITEFIYLRDLFDTRMNTVFKLYYQAWLLLGLAGVGALLGLWRRGGWPRLAAGATVVLLGASLLYAPSAGLSQARSYDGQPTLDGTAYLQSSQPDEYAAYLWLEAHAQAGAVLAEAPGDEYVVAHNRLSGWTGMPSVLGWVGHELQWRGDIPEIWRRREDLERIYTSNDPNEVSSLLWRYGVSYLVIGPHERELYDLTLEHEQWYATFLRPVFGRGSLRLYRVSGH